MYLVELSPGKEAVYGTAADFVDAIRRGEIGWSARIYHQAKDTWLPVDLHPHFKQVFSAGPHRTEWTFLRAPRNQAVLVASKELPEKVPVSEIRVGLAKSVHGRSWRRLFAGLLGSRGG